MAPKLPQLAERMQGIEQEVGARLDKLGESLPEVKPPRNQPTFADYLAQARLKAQRDPDFAAQLNAALAQYRAAGG